jgi:hypothetical protein
MDKITASSSLSWNRELLLPKFKTFTIEVDSSITLTSLYGCIHENGGGTDGIKTQQKVACDEGTISITLDISKASIGNGFQFFGFRRSSTGTKELVAALKGNSTDLLRVSTLRLEAPTSGTIPTLSL